MSGIQSATSMAAAISRQQYMPGQGAAAHGKATSKSTTSSDSSDNGDSCGSASADSSRSATATSSAASIYTNADGDTISISTGSIVAAHNDTHKTIPSAQAALTGQSLPLSKTYLQS